MEACIEIGDLVRDNLGRLGIVVREIPRPSSEWLCMQLDRRVGELRQDARWLMTFTKSGGAVNCPEALMSRIRRATEEDFHEVYDLANPFAQDELRRLFPQWAEA